MKRNDKKEYNDITKISRKRIQLFKILQIIIHLECFRFLSILQYSFLFHDWRIYQISHSHSHQILFILIPILKILLNNNISLSSERVQLPYTIPFTNNNIPIIHNTRLSIIHHSLDSISLMRRINYQFYLSIISIHTNDRKIIIHIESHFHSKLKYDSIQYHDSHSIPYILNEKYGLRFLNNFTDDDQFFIQFIPSTIQP